jgi:signal transduction histidine kinase
VFLNLISNAIHSLVDEEERIIDISYVAREDIEVTISDTGCGISEEDLIRVFDPFFSKKGIYAESGSSQSEFECIGLGLSVCYTILEKHHNSSIDISSKLGSGTKVIFNLQKA